MKSIYSQVSSSPWKTTGVCSIKLGLNANEEHGKEIADSNYDPKYFGRKYTPGK